MSDYISVADFLIIGIFTGLNASCWGLYKDSLYEKVSINKFSRSILLSLIITVVLYYSLKFIGITNYNLGIFFGAVVLFERFLTEIYKGFFRSESQRKYKIPVYFHVGKHIIKNVLLKEGIGILVIFLTVLFFYYVHSLSFIFSQFKGSLVVGLLLGLFMGILEAIGGAEKDAPFEGFDALKIYRSPVVHMIWGGIFSYFTSTYLLIFLAAGGLGRMTIEFYKTFIVNKVPGKFKATSATYPFWKLKRNAVVIPYAMTWIVFFFYLLGL